MLMWPRSPSEMAAAQTARRREALQRARRSTFLAPRLTGIDPARIDEEWHKIPLLRKDDLRALTPAQFAEEFCIAPRTEIAEWWRSGGVTGKPLFYGRSPEDLHFTHLSFQRVWQAIGATPDDAVHVSFPLGIHPVGQIALRAAQKFGMATQWAGAGNTTPSELQLDLITTLQPTIWAGMPSYCLHLANLAEQKGIDLAAGSVRKIVVSAEQLTDAKRAKIERSWGATVFDCLGMTEGGMLMSESLTTRPWMLAWSDLFHFEVVDEATGEAMPDGEPGSLVVTPLYANTVTPFLRWLSGDQVTMRRQDHDPSDPLSLMPLIRHAHRTLGFFKIRGININHTEFEDFIFRIAAVADFKVVLETAQDREIFRLVLELNRGADAGGLVEDLGRSVKQTFEVTADIVVQELGTLAREFESSIKAPRFADRRTA
jgi:phenylacetate-CoA ligase